MIETGSQKQQNVNMASSESPATPTIPQNDNTSDLTSVKTWLFLILVLLGSFLVALDRSIVSTAIPVITDEFNALSSYDLYLLPVKTVLLTSSLIFEAASALCGVAPNSTAFIVGRAICGVGAAGIFAGSIVCIIYAVPLHIRPRVQGFFGAFFGVASISGPLIGGGLTSRVTWRWCFYLNLPISSVAIAVIALLLKIPDRDTTKLPLSKKLKKLDFVGTALFIPGFVCLLLALQWGGQTYTWNEWRIIILLAFAGVLLAAFAAIQIWMPATATLSPRIFKQRSVLSAILVTFGISAGNFIFVYYLPTWFQSVQGVDSAQSGIRLLPTMIKMIVGSLVGGFTNSKVGYYTLLVIVGSCLMSVGAGLITTFPLDTSSGKWIGYQILYGIGMDVCFQVPNLTVQAVLPKMDVPIGLSLMLFCNLLASTIFVSVGENVLSNQLLSRLTGMPGFDPSLVTSGVATSLVDILPLQFRQTILVAYNKSLQEVFCIALILCCISVLGCATLEWKNVKKGKNNMATAEAAAEAQEKKFDSSAAEK
ncbi:major facilitator superfamily domain-containing protein [Pseudomassariella vexata]|uniref:Major facilitator superfamily domain-containing protein n=1 Tax=Pseudomassariella vexata TaxID=1141098 RepID=A0A1Y2DSW3_9PEZI|nr:major facilitator superfamily domain-containing protein [Pseudomassariella vexata]ORY62368.1 major facilitator superfamily domain-containing protein [Pseudomassariella vexata]